MYFIYIWHLNSEIVRSFLLPFFALKLHVFLQTRRTRWYRTQTVGTRSTRLGSSFKCWRRCDAGASSSTGQWCARQPTAPSPRRTCASTSSGRPSVGPSKSSASSAANCWPAAWPESSGGVARTGAPWGLTSVLNILIWVRQTTCLTERDFCPPEKTDSKLVRDVEPSVSTPVRHQIK